MTHRKCQAMCARSHRENHYIIYTTPACYGKDAEVFHMRCDICFRMWDVDECNGVWVK
jgi:hypothetical protein